MKKCHLIAGGAGLLLFAILQFRRPTIDHPPVSQDLEAPKHIKAILVRACYDCHSNQTRLHWYDLLQPIYGQVADHGRQGRAGLNFSQWDKLTPVEKKAKLWESVNQIEQGAMPIASYALVHRDARVTKPDLGVLKTYLMGLVANNPNDTTHSQELDNQAQMAAVALPAKTPISLNGIAYLPDYENWAVISVSDRFDNGTMRVIYGNDMAMQAVKQNRINPWPDGTILAKAAWDKQEDHDGNITTGFFKQVEFMVKDAGKFKTTGGWGFARFKTPQLVPYGKTVLFTTECLYCHQPMKKNDFVFTLPIKN